MKIDPNKCIGCGICVPYCPMGVIYKDGKTMSIDHDECVECGICINCVKCPKESFYQDELSWPRILRAEFSNPLVPHASTGITGRGTEEMKSNDVTGRFKPGMFGLGIELGRPGIGTRLTEVEKVSMALAEFVEEFESVNPVTQLMVDKKTGKFREDALGEKVLSAIVEFTSPLEALPKVLERLRMLADKVNTVFSVSLISILDENGNSPVEGIAKECGFPVADRTKINVGLGRIPAKEETNHDTYIA